MSRLLEPVPCEPFRYVPHVYSVGDRYAVTLSYPDEPTLRSDLTPLGLGLAADIRLGGAYIESEGIWVEAFGPCVTLQIGPEDAYEFLQAEHHRQATKLARAFAEKGITRFVTEPFEPTNRGHFDATFSPAHARLGEHELAVRERKRTAAAVEDVVGEPPLNPAIERYRAIFEQLEIPLPDADEDEATLTARIIVARDGLSAVTLTTPMAIVSAALTFLRDMRLPCLFDARRAVLEDRDDLFEFVIANLNACLEGDPRRFVPGPDADTFVALTATERALLRW